MHAGLYIIEFFLCVCVLYSVASIMNIRKKYITNSLQR